MLRFRRLTAIDSNAEPDALYTIVACPAPHHIVIGPTEDGDYEVTVYEGTDDIGAGEPVGYVSADSESEARQIAEVLVRSDLSLLPYFDAIDTCLARLDCAFGEDRISQLFTIAPTLAIAV